MASLRESERDPPAKEIPMADWTKHRDTIERLYIHERKKLKVVADILDRDYGFKATEAQYKSKFSLLGIRKNKRHRVAAGGHSDDNGPGDKRQCTGTDPLSIDNPSSIPEPTDAPPDPHQQPSIAVDGSVRLNESESVGVETDYHLRQTASLGHVSEHGTLSQFTSLDMPQMPNGMPITDVSPFTAASSFGVSNHMGAMGTTQATNEPGYAQQHRPGQSDYNLIYGAPPMLPMYGPVWPNWEASQHVSGASQQTSGTSQLTNGLSRLKSGTSQLVSGPSQLASATSQHASGKVFSNRVFRHPIHQATQAGNYEAVKLLLELAPNCADMLDSEDVTPLWIAAHQGHLKILDLLLLQQVNVKATIADWGRTPLHQAAQGGYLKVVERLLKYHADADPRDENGLSPLWIAAEHGHDEIVRLLLSKGADKEVASKDGDGRPIHQAAQNGHLAVVQVLLDAGAEADPEKRSFPGKDSLGDETPSPFWLAAQNGDVSIGELLLEKEANPKFVVNPSKRQPIHQAAQNGYTAFVQLLIDHKVDVDACEVGGWTALMIAAQQGYMEIVERLLRSGANVNAVEKYNATALLVASHGGHLEVVRILALHGARLIATKDSRRRPIHQAAQNGHYEVLKFLVEELHDDVNAEDYQKLTPLTLAAQGKGEIRVEMIRFLHENGAIIPTRI